MSTLGLTAGELSWLRAVAPLVGCAGPLLGGPAADRLASYKPLLVAALLLSAGVYPCLLLVPPVERQPPRAPELFLRCGEQGSMVGSELCADGCPAGDSLERAYFVHGCAYTCEEEAAAPAAPPHFCLEGTGRTTHCEVLDAGDGLVLNASLARLVRRAAEGACWYPLVDFSRAGERHRSLVCGGQPAGCELRCRLRQLSRPPLFGDTLCRTTVGDPALTFWLYFGLRGAAEALLSLALVLVTCSALLLRRRHGSDLGAEALWALLGLAASAPVCGFLLDQRPPDAPPNFRPSLYAFCALMVVALVLAAVLPARPESSQSSPSGRMSRQLASSLFSCEFFGVVCALGLLGVLYGVLETFLYDHVRGLGGSQLQNGLGWTVGSVLLLPLVMRAEAVISYCGHHHVLIVAFIVYIVRYVSYAYIVSPWLVLVAESLELFTVHLAWLAAVLLVSELGPPAVGASLQAVITATHFGVGRSVAAGVVWHVLPLTSGFVLLCGGSVLAAVAASLYLLLYHCCRTLRLNQRAAERRKRQMYRKEGAMLNGSSRLST